MTKVELNTEKAKLLNKVENLINETDNSKKKESHIFELQKYAKELGDIEEQIQKKTQTITQNIKNLLSSKPRANARKTVQQIYINAKTLRNANAIKTQKLQENSSAHIASAKAYINTKKTILTIPSLSALNEKKQPEQASALHENSSAAAAAAIAPEIAPASAHVKPAQIASLSANANIQQQSSALNKNKPLGTNLSVIEEPLYLYDANTMLKDENIYAIASSN